MLFDGCFMCCCSVARRVVPCVYDNPWCCRLKLSFDDVDFRILECNEHPNCNFASRFFVLLQHYTIGWVCHCSFFGVCNIVFEIGQCKKSIFINRKTWLILNVAMVFQLREFTLTLSICLIKLVHKWMWKEIKSVVLFPTSMTIFVGIQRNITYIHTLRFTHISLQLVGTLDLGFILQQRFIQNVIVYNL